MKNGWIVGFLSLTVLCAEAGDLTLESGDYRVVFSEKPELYSIVGVFYRGSELGTRTGFYSNVLAPSSGKYIGAGHTEGGVEKLLGCALTVDGKKMEVGNLTVKGEKLVFSKTSMLDNVKMSVTYTLTAQELKIDKQFEMLAEQKVHSLYLFQFCWNSCSTDYFFERRNGESGTGKFLSDGKMRVEGEPRACCFAQYFPDFKLGVMNWLCNYGVYSGKNLLWDRPNYHKYYFWVDLPPVVPAGYKSPVVSMVVRAFEAPSREAWEREAATLTATLRKQYSPAPNPSVFRPLPETGLSLAGIGKFLCHKIALPLDPASQYAISFEIRKTAPMSAKTSDHYVVAGYYDSARKFHSIAGFASDVKADGEWHKVQGAFKTPSAQEDIYLYVYNSHSSGELSLRNLEIKRQ